MRLMKKITIIIFCILILIPVLKFDFTENAISEIDNRALAANPFTNEGDDFTKDLENYVNDRIGFRNEMIYGYTVLNDKLFGKMVHPSYTYGTDGYVFGAGLDVNIRYDDYHESFVDMVKKIQDYCDERDIPFLFVFEPAKPAVMTEYIADGINYNREWVDIFFEELDKRGVRYLDNTETLKEAKEKGESVFNQKYDANHWNYKGAYYGTNAILEELRNDFPEIHVNTDKDIIWEEKKEKSLLVSKFPIDEMVPISKMDMNCDNVTEDFQGELELNENYQTFGYYFNEVRRKEGAPKALVFQGSYMNSYGSDYLKNAFGEYVYIHDYQNVLNLPYYMNIFKPDCVVFEVAEYTLTNTYFDYEKMQALDFQSPCKTIPSEEIEIMELEQLGDVKVQEGETLTRLDWTTEEIYNDIWLVQGETEYDLMKTDTGYTVTVLTEVYKQYDKELMLNVR